MQIKSHLLFLIAAQLLLKFLSKNVKEWTSCTWCLAWSSSTFKNMSQEQVAWSCVEILK
jgi:hypothetical protein